MANFLQRLFGAMNNTGKQQTIAIDPLKAGNWIGNGTALTLLNRFEEAEQCMQHAEALG